MCEHENEFYSLNNFDSTLGRRDFLRHLAGATALVAVGGGLTDVFGNGLQRAQAANHGIDDGVEPHAGPVRGPQIEVTPPPPPPRTWDNGDFINYVQLDGSERHFSFTIDDGPSPYNTDPILRALEARKAFATFFLVGVNVLAWPEIARRIRDAGHEIGNHSVYHTPYTDSALSAQIPENQDIIRSITGVVPVANRAPGLTRGWQILEMVRCLGMYELHTTLNQNDWRSPRWSADAIVAELRREIRNGGFSLNHDGGGPRPTASAFPYLLDVALSQGYELHRATDMINLGKPLPGHNSYDPARNSPRGAHSPRKYSQNNNFCKYNPQKEMGKRLDDPHIKSKERSRIVEVLADIEEMQKAA